MNRFEGLMKAHPKKRYKSFVTSVADCEEVWTDASFSEAETTVEEMISVWPEKEFAQAACTQREAVMIEVHDFCRILQNNPHVVVRVFPNGIDYFDTDAEKLLLDIESELELIE